MSPPATAPRSPLVVPAWIALASIVGLVSALVGDGVFDAISWLVFASLIGLAVRAWVRRERGR